MENTTIMINGQPYHVVARNADELEQESLRMVEERTVTLPEVKDFYNDQDTAALFDDAVLRAIALGRPFERQEIFQKYWDLGVEMSPQWDSRFVLLQEATGTTERVWGVRPDPTGLRVSVDAYLEKLLQEQKQESLTWDYKGQPLDIHVCPTCGHPYSRIRPDAAEEIFVVCPVQGQHPKQESLETTKTQPATWLNNPENW